MNAVQFGVIIHSVPRPTSQPKGCFLAGDCVGDPGTQVEVGSIDAVRCLRPGGAALHVNKAAIQNHGAEAARDSGQPISLRGAGQNDKARARALDVGAGNITLDAEHGPTGLPVVASLHATQETAAAGLEKGSWKAKVVEGGEIVAPVSVDLVVPQPAPTWAPM